MTAPGPVARAAQLASLGHDGTLSTSAMEAASAGLHDDDPRVRAAALGALVRAGPTDTSSRALIDATDDTDPAVRRRAAELAPRVHSRGVVEPLLALLDDADVTVVEAAAWALGELGDVAVNAPGAVPRLASVVTTHREALAREAAVAALGALGDRRGRDAVLHATTDRPAVRRRAVLALAPFDGPEVDAAIERALTDHDWQVRQAAEDLRDA